MCLSNQELTRVSPMDHLHPVSFNKDWNRGKPLACLHTSSLNKYWTRGKPLDCLFSFCRNKDLTKRRYPAGTPSETTLWNQQEDNEVSAPLLLDKDLTRERPMACMRPFSLPLSVERVSCFTFRVPVKMFGQYQQSLSNHQRWSGEELNVNLMSNKANWRPNEYS